MRINVLTHTHSTFLQKFSTALDTSVRAVVYVVHVYMHTHACIHNAHKYIDLHTSYIFTEILGDARYIRVHSRVHGAHVHAHTKACIHNAHAHIDLHTFSQKFLTEILDGARYI